VAGRALPTGKLPPRLLAELLGALPAPGPEVRLGPAVGEDACALALPAGTLVVATDPVTLTASDVGGHAVVVNANDVAVMGVRPRWFLAAVLLPPETDEAQVRALFAGLREALDREGAALVGGHTELTEAVRQPVVVGQMLGLAEDGRTLPTGGLRPGDAVVQVGPAPVEGAALLADADDPRLATVSADLREAARRALRDPGISVVGPALAAATAGAVAMHDPTEGGLATGLAELARASGTGLEVDAGAVLWFEPGRALARALGADPWGVIASGTLLAGFRPDAVPGALRALEAGGWRPAVVARATAGDALVCDGAPLPRFERDELSRLRL